MIKILYSDNSPPEYFSASSENDDTSSDSSPNRSNIVFYISPAFHGFLENFPELCLTLQTPFSLEALLSQFFSQGTRRD